MGANCEYLEGRHLYWRKRIGDAGIWDASGFKPVKFIVRKRSKTYDGLFCRKRIVVGSKLGWEDQIIFYQQYADISAREIDDTLVHEMIHQYIYQNGTKDSCVHGKVFKEFMCRINQAFEGELTIRVSGGIKERRGPGDTLHRLILVYKENGVCLCCKVNPNKTDMFMSLIREHKDEWRVRKYELCESNDRYFDSFTACTRRLHGVRMTEEELAEVYRECGVRAVGSGGVVHKYL
ncbi:MAG: SprT-like domain-containing protein [Muribaculaceae bacterium]|nr:SprT-like domain-containing protein [Muribaculaceae bacterium]